MYILSDNLQEFGGYLSYFPLGLKNALMKAESEELCEIRLRRNRPIVLIYRSYRCFLSANGGNTREIKSAYIPSAKELERFLETAFEFSLYAHESELAQGYITVKGGHRIGLCGELREGKLRRFSDITAVNFRIAHEHIGIGEALKEHIVENKRVKSTLIISPPMCGKTSLLRDIARMLSEEGTKVGVCDTRGEIAAVYDGIPCMNVGDADILSGSAKVEGMNMLLRTMSPEVIICDELGGSEDFTAVAEVFGSGTAIIATAHCQSRSEIKRRKNLSKLAEEFNLIITLEGIGEICEVYHA